MSPKFLSSADTVIKTAIKKCRDDLNGRLRDKLRDMASKNQTGYGPAWLEMLNWYKADLLVRASKVIEAYKKAAEADSKPIKNGKLESLLTTVRARIEAEFSTLSAEAEGFFTAYNQNTHWFIPSLNGEATRVLDNEVETLRLDLEMLHQAKSQRAFHSPLVQALVVGVVLTVLGIGAYVFEHRNENATPKSGVVITSRP